MEITFVWSWFSFLIGFITPGIVLILWVLAYGIKKGMSARSKKADASNDMNSEWEKLLNQFNRNGR